MTNKGATETTEHIGFYTIQIDDLPEERIAATGDGNLATILRTILRRRDVDHIGGDVHVAITRPDGSSTTSTVAALRDGLVPNTY